MKTTISTLLVAFLFGFTQTLHAQQGQGKSKGKKKAKTEKVTKNKSAKAVDSLKQKEEKELKKAKKAVDSMALKEDSGKANAYGKNKGQLSGKDFGQNRAEQA